MGEKMAEGTKDELLATCLPFRNMWDAMFRTQTRVHKEPMEVSTL
jgi:hypothetical protein